jgi:chromosome segregation ATPase
LVLVPPDFWKPSVMPPMVSGEDICTVHTLTELLAEATTARQAAQSLADARVGELVALGERVGRAEAELATAEAVVDRLAIEMVTLRGRAEAAEAEAVLLRDQATAAEARAAAAEGKKALLRAALAEAHRPFWRRWLD